MPIRDFCERLRGEPGVILRNMPPKAITDLVPDNVQEEGNREALRISPTNAGLQLNARQAAVILGYLTFPEYAKQTLANLHTLDGIPKWRGHLLNWYTTTTLEPIRPYIASTVDSGNFLASFAVCGWERWSCWRLRCCRRCGKVCSTSFMDVQDAFGRRVENQICAAYGSKSTAESDAWSDALLTLDLSSPTRSRRGDRISTSSN